MSRLHVLAAAALGSLLLAGAASAGGARSATLLIRHQQAHCHAWSSSRAGPSRNGTVMPMMGGYVSRAPGLMSHMGAWTRVTFGKPGVYRFRTRAGEDYLPGITTTGADNVLTLTVTVG